MAGSFLRGVVVGLVCALLGGAAVALAGSGVGGVFNLGVTNSVNAKTTLTGATPGIQLQVTNTSTTPSTSGLAVTSASAATTGVLTNSGGGSAGGFFVNAGAKPFTVNSQTKVSNLNADLLDGLDSAALQKRVTGTCPSGSAVRIVNAAGGVSCQPVGGAGGSWSLAGNGGTTPGTNFLGTTDAHDLVVKTNGSERLRVTESGNLGIGTASPSAQLDVSNSGGSGSATAGHFQTTVADGFGLVGEATSGPAAVGVVGSGPIWAAAFSGKVSVAGDIEGTGNLYFTGTKNFRIDDPLDPANKYLAHAAIESNEVLNTYSGNITTDGSGLATVQLPAWFDRINTGFRYQLTAIGTFAQAIIGTEIADNRFTIRTDKPNVKVSWQVTARRDDPFMRAHPFEAEQAKTGVEQGRYVTPEAYGRPASEGIDEVKPVPKQRH